MADTVLYETDRGVATITLNRPEALNALTDELKESLYTTLRRANEDDEARAVVITGAGRGFCVGQDLREHADALSRGGRVGNTVREYYNPIIRMITSMAKPVVASVNGTAAGAGASLAYACDLRITAESASFLMAFSKIGLGADSGASWTLQRLVGYGRAMELLMLATPVPAADALSMGLVNRVVPDAELATATRSLAQQLAEGPSLAYAAIKHSLTFASSHSLEDVLENEAALQDRAGTSEDHRNATAAFLAKEKPTFKGR